MLKPKVTGLPGHIQSVYVQNITKLYARILAQAEADDNRALVTEVSQMLSDKMALFIQSSDLEVQERVRRIFRIVFLWCSKCENIYNLLSWSITELSVVTLNKLSIWILNAN